MRIFAALIALTICCRSSSRRFLRWYLAGTCLVDVDPCVDSTRQGLDWASHLVLRWYLIILHNSDIGPGPWVVLFWYLIRFTVLLAVMLTPTVQIMLTSNDHISITTEPFSLSLKFLAVHV